MFLKAQELCIWEKDAKHIGTNLASEIPNLIFDAYCIGDARFFKVPKKAIAGHNAPGIRIYQSCVKDLMSPDDCTNYIKTIGRDGFCSNLEKGTYHGYSVVWFALQIAVWSGSTNIILAGCPQNYNNGYRFYSEKNPSGVDNFTNKIIKNYKDLKCIFNQLNIKLKVLGKSRLEEAGIERIGDF